MKMIKDERYSNHLEYGNFVYYLSHVCIPTLPWNPFRRFLSARSSCCRRGRAHASRHRHRSSWQAEPANAFPSLGRCFLGKGRCGQSILGQSLLIILMTASSFDMWHRIEQPFLKILIVSFVVWIMDISVASFFIGAVMSTYSSSTLLIPFTSQSF